MSATTSLQPPALSGHQRAVRMMWAFLLLTAAVIVWLVRDPYRGGEATASAWLTDRLIAAPVFAYPPDALILVGRPVDLGFEITPQCSSMIVTLIFLLGSALLAIVAPRFRVRRILTSLVLAGALAIGVNVVRVVLIVFASSHWGHAAGYGVSHESVGSTLTVFGVAFALLVYLWLLARDRSPGGAP